jgi:YidC/Oxa1 family membrane protein insertase
VFATVLSPLYDAVAWIINTIHSGLSHVTSAGWTWGLSIILLTILMRLLLFPLFVKQIRSQREMQLLQPKIAELKTLYPDDREKQGQAQMALFKEHGVNPFSGCLPLIVQLPVFFALFGVLHKFAPGKGGVYHGYAHLSAATVKDVATSKFLGVPIAAALNSSKAKLDSLNATAGTVKTVTIILIVLMMVTSYLTSRQLMARSKASGQPSAPGADSTQKVLLYGMPIFFGILGYNFQMGVLLYWLTTNVWTYGQQAFVLNRMDNEPLALSSTGSAAAAAPAAEPAAPPAAEPAVPAEVDPAVEPVAEPETGPAQAG